MLELECLALIEQLVGEQLASSGLHSGENPSLRLDEAGNISSFCLHNFDLCWALCCGSSRGGCGGGGGDGLGVGDGVGRSAGPRLDIMAFTNLCGCWLVFVITQAVLLPQLSVRTAQHSLDRLLWGGDWQRACFVSAESVVFDCRLFGGLGVT